jgi:hypothetical protein
MRYSLLLIVFFNVFLSFAQKVDSSYFKLYKSSDIIFTGVLRSKYQLPTAKECDDLRMLLEYELTEVQKGPRRYKVMIESSDSTQKLNHEFLIFCDRVKVDGEKKNIALHTEEVCMDCPNPGIKAVYRIVYKGLFRTIKPPIVPGDFKPIGCGCH